MHFFITGATGYIGLVCAEKAVAEGDTVHGLSRSAAGDEKLKAIGAVPIRGDLSSFDILTQESAKADVVIHCAFNHDFTPAKFEESVQLEREAIDAMAKALKGSGKRLIVSSAAGGRVADPNGGEIDETAPEDENFPMRARIKAEKYSLEKNNDDIRVSSLRVAPFVYGRGGSTFIPMLIAKAHSTRVSLYVGDGSTKTTSLHVDDAATLYLKVAKHSTGGIWNATGATTTTAKEIAEAVGTLLNVPVRSVTREEAVKEENLGPVLAMVMGTQSRTSNKKAREELGWELTGVDMLTDVAYGSYIEYAATLSQKV